jgi:SAM-dependent methyltransferase
MMLSSWDDSGAVRAYERFCRQHARYRVANEALAAHAALAPGQRVLDVAAGTGRTADAVLRHIGARGRVVCVEPARAMRIAGEQRLADPRVTWTADLPDEQGGAFDRVVCGAGIWQLLPLEATLRRLAALVVRYGALVFNIPAQYLLETDRPGAGRDPMLLELPALVERPRAPDDPTVTASGLPRGVDAMERLLTAAGLRADRWSVEQRFTQAAYRDWLKIPAVSDGMLAGVPAGERARRLDAAYQRADHRSWRWERWIGWTAWRLH